MHRKYTGLYEEPTTYTRDYINYSLEESKVINHEKISKELSNESQKEKHLISTPSIIRAHDTLQMLDYETRLPFNALWDSKDALRNYIKRSHKRQVLGDKDLEKIIKTRPRVYMAPTICLDDVQDIDTRKLMINFTYTTVLNQAEKEVWKDFKPRSSCKNIQDLKKSINARPLKIPNLPVGFQSAARKWDSLQDRSFIDDNAIKDRKDTAKTLNHEKLSTDLMALNEKCRIKELIEKHRLSLAYDKFPLSYTGFRPQVALGIPLERKKLPVVHPYLTMSQAIQERYTDDGV